MTIYGNKLKVTSLDCYRRTHPRYAHVTPIMSYTMVDAQCDKLSTVVGQTKYGVNTVDGRRAVAKFF